MNKPEFGFGQHLMVDGYGCDGAKLRDLGVIYEFLNEYPDQIHMTKIMPPYVFKYEGVKPEDWGLSGFVLIAESHISVHTFPDKDYLSLDIFSCKAFDADSAVAHIKEYFAIDKLEVRILDRGLHFPNHLGEAAKIVREDRRQKLL
ncbi:MAG: adenosylmethionine decarboxylase [Pseudomonadota bacterium]